MAGGFVSDWLRSKVCFIGGSVAKLFNVLDACSVCCELVLIVGFSAAGGAGTHPSCPKVCLIGANFVFLARCTEHC